MVDYASIIALYVYGWHIYWKQFKISWDIRFEFVLVVSDAYSYVVYFHYETRESINNSAHYVFLYEAQMQMRIYRARDFAYSKVDAPGLSWKLVCNSRYN